jgi:Beta-galactosidase/beta-glucuronidase
MKKTIALNNDWTFRQVSVDTNGKDTPWLNATVPGHVHLDLLDNHVIDDPYWRDNEKSQQWIGEVDWEYQTHFNYADALSGNSHYEMCFDGLDTYADVYLNDQLILTADNMYDGWRVNVKDFLVHGSNHLRIVFHSVIKRTLPLYQENGFVYPANTSQPEPKLSVYSRKPGYHFGWDWGPRLVTCGIWRPICLEVFSCNRLSDVQFVQHSLDSTVSVLSLNVELNAPAESELSLSLIDADNSFEPVTLTIAPSTAAAVVHFTIDNPKFWWTLGLGEQPLYKLSLSLLKDGSVIDSWQHNVGLRTVELVHEDDESGKSFYFKLNGEPLYIKGSNCIPADFFVPRLGEIDYRKMLGYAVDANMNMLRLWGGAIYEEKVFYTLCDELGVLVWQDFMFACAAYPCGTEMAERIASEAAYNVKRIRNHTSLALWCGNNEISEGWHTWGWQQRYEYDEATCEKVWREYEAIFHEILPQAVAQYDPSRAYWASSPKYGFVDPKAKTDGDMHYWGVWFLGHERNGFNEYLPRFMSEYGLQAMPD